MQSLEKAFRLIGLSALLLLATLGIGISGGIPISSSKRKDKNQITVEWVHENKEKPEDSSEEFL